MPTLLDVTPSLASHDAAYGGLLNAVTVGDGGVSHGCRELADSPNVILGEFGLRQLLTSGDTPLGDHVAGVVASGPKKQMVRTDAPSIVAMMENAQPIWDGTVMEGPRKTGRDDLHSVMASKGYLPVAVRAE